MHRVAALTVLTLATAVHAGEWHVNRINAPARVSAIETDGRQVHVNAGGLWYKITMDDGKVSLAFIDAPDLPKLPEGALPDSRVAIGSNDIARAWLSEPTTRYDHGILGDKIEAGALVIETRDGKRQTVSLKDDAVFEDLEPRLADLDGDGHDKVVVVKSYLKRGSALAVIGLRKGKYEILAETPPLGAPHRWLDPAGIAAFTGGGKIDIALVRQPHVIGELELWGWRGGDLNKIATLSDTANHIAGTRAIDMAAVADFDGDKIPDIAIPSLDRNQLRIVTFVPDARTIASVALPAKAVTNLGLLAESAGPPAIAVGLSDGTLAIIHYVQ
jgi:hypothetical protein